MKCSVNELNKNIAYYKDEYQRDPYLFMSDDTANAIAEYTKSIMTVKPLKLTGGYVGKFVGYRIYPDNDLEYGEVELR